MFPTKIIDNLYLGNNQNGLDYLKYGFTKIINVTKNNNHYEVPTVWINIDDAVTSDLYSHLEKITTFIHNIIHNTDQEKMLVHCQAGISRSATIVIAYIMRLKRYSLQDALKFVQSKRNIVLPNNGFLEQLKKFERWLNSTNGYFKE
jgi:protein-tyrosine phosphatase